MSLATYLASTVASNPRGMISDPIGTVTDHVVYNPGAALGSVAGSLMTPGFGLISSGIGRGIDSYNQSNRADEGLQATGIQSTGPMGQDWTTSGVRDFFGDDARDQARDIEEEVAGLRDEWYELDQRDADGAGTFIPRSIMRNNSDYGSYTDLDRPDQAFSTPLQGPGRRASDTAAGQFYNRDTKRFEDAYTGGDIGPNWDGNPVIGPQSVVPVTTAPLAPPGIDGDGGLWYDEGGGGGMDADGPGGDDWSGWEEDYGGWDY